MERIIDQLYGNRNAETPVKHVFENKIQKAENFNIALGQLNDNFNKGFITEDSYNKALGELDGLIEKAFQHKYIRREGTKGNYKYIYRESEIKHKDKKVELDESHQNTDINNVYKYLSQISGVGKEKAKVILAYMGSVREMKKMSGEKLKEKLLKIPGVSLSTAEKVVHYFKEYKKDEKSGEQEEKNDYRDRLKKTEEKYKSVLDQYQKIEDEHTKLSKNPKKTYDDEKLRNRSNALGRWLQDNRQEFLMMKNQLGYYIPSKFDAIEKYGNKEYEKKVNELLDIVNKKDVGDLQSKLDLVNKSQQSGKKDSERDYMVKTLIEQSKRPIHPITKLTKDELNKLSEKVNSNWKTFWNDGGKQIYNSGGKNINENIVKKYPLEVWTVLRESMETSGMGMTDTSYLKRNEDRANKMRDIESKYDIKKEHANLITSRDINSYHERMVRDETLAGRIVPEEVLKDYPDIKKMQEKILKDYPELSKQQDKGENKEKFLKDKNKADTQSIVYKEAEQFNKKKLSNENPEHIKSLYIAASTIDPKYLSKETKSKMDQLIEDIYVNSYVENDKPLYESTSLKDSLNVLSKESVKLDKKGEYAIDQKTIDNIQDFIVSALKEQANKKTTEKKNYKLF